MLHKFELLNNKNILTKYNDNEAIKRKALRLLKSDLFKFKTNVFGNIYLKESDTIRMRQILTFINVKILKGKNKIEKISILNTKMNE